MGKGRGADGGAMDCCVFGFLGAWMMGDEKSKYARFKLLGRKEGRRLEA